MIIPLPKELQKVLEKRRLKFHVKNDEPYSLKILRKERCYIMISFHSFTVSDYSADSALFYIIKFKLMQR